ncbi:hypothetical protein JCM3770_000867 [Rhodotorula araucariae]
MFISAPRPEDNFGNSYQTSSSGTNSQGNHYCDRDYGNGSNSYHYSNNDGSYYYSNSDGSKYYNSGDGGYASYTKSDGSGWTSSGSGSGKNYFPASKPDSPSASDRAASPGGEEAEEEEDEHCASLFSSASFIGAQTSVGSFGHPVTAAGDKDYDYDAAADDVSVSDLASVQGEAGSDGATGPHLLVLHSGGPRRSDLALGPGYIIPEGEEDDQVEASDDSVDPDIDSDVVGDFDDADDSAGVDDDDFDEDEEHFDEDEDDYDAYDSE